MLLQTTMSMCASARRVEEMKWHNGVAAHDAHNQQTVLSLAIVLTASDGAVLAREIQRYSGSASDSTGMM